MGELSKESFDKLTLKEQQQLATKALAWFCVLDSVAPHLGIQNRIKIDTIKIVLGKFMNGEIVTNIKEQ